MHLTNLAKKTLAGAAHLSRSMLYYHPKQPEKDWRLKIQIEEALHANPSYGYRRVASVLRVNPKRAQRVMRLFGIKAFRRRAKRPRKARDSNASAVPYRNLLLTIPFPNHPGIAWVSDFTYLKFHGRFVYLATVVDLFTREVVGWSVLNAHTAQLTITALIDALGKHGAPALVHSDQGNEYRAKAYVAFVGRCGIEVSMSRKASPWENGYQESFYSQFKVDLGDPDRFKNLAELTVALHLQILYYNNQRIHSKLKMPPSVYAQRQAVFTN